MALVRATAVFTFIGSLALATVAGATTITLSDVSSDSTPSSQLDAIFNFAITGASELTLTVTNTTDLDPGDNDAARARR